ncbi:MAG TPA: hypothetical protein V6D07_18585 [Trichocoleus sp.]
MSRFIDPLQVDISLEGKSFVASCKEVSAEGSRLQDALGGILEQVLRPCSLNQLTVEQKEIGGSVKWTVVAPSDAGFSWDESRASAIAGYCLFVGIKEDPDIFDIEVRLPNGVLVDSISSNEMSEWLSDFMDMDAERQIAAFAEGGSAWLNK